MTFRQNDTGLKTRNYIFLYIFQEIIQPIALGSRNQNMEKSLHGQLKGPYWKMPMYSGGRWSGNRLFLELGFQNLGAEGHGF